MSGICSHKWSCLLYAKGRVGETTCKLVVRYLTERRNLWEADIVRDRLDLQYIDDYQIDGKVHLDIHVILDRIEGHYIFIFTEHISGVID